MAKIENTSNYSITLRKLIDLFDWNEKTYDEIDKHMLKDSYEILYAKKDGKGILSTARKSQIRNYTDTSAHRSYEAVFNTFFQTNKGTTYVSTNEEEYTSIKGKRLRDDIHRVWLEKIKNAPNFVFEEKIEEFLHDSLLLTAKPGTIIKDIKEYLEENQKTTEAAKQADFLTVLTIISITRNYASELPEWIIPEYESPISGNAPESEEIKKGIHFIESAQWQKAVEIFENLERSATDKKSNLYNTQKRLYKYNAKIFYLLSEAYRGLWKESNNSKERLKIAQQVRHSLFSSADTYHSAEARLKIAQEYFDENNRTITDPTEYIFPYDIELCAEQCHMLISEHPESTRECGEAYWILYELSNDYGYIPPKAESKKYYLQKACAYNHREALKLHNIENTISVKKNSKHSTDHSTGTYFLNDTNKYSKYISKTCPEGWFHECYKLDKYGDIDDSWTKSKEKQKHFLISDDYDKNLSELLYLLETLKSSEHIADPYNRVEFYIRGIEEKIAPFVDTAMSRMKDLIFPIHILDDNKMAARVLAQHPLFYPIRRISDDEQVQLTLVIIGDTNCCEWLLRESFWMLTFNKSNVKTKILLLSPTAPEMVKNITALCPGMEQATKENIKTRTGGEISKQFPYIVGKECSCHSSEMIENIKNILKEGKTYFAIDMGSDTDNASMAIQIRELTVRKWVSDCEKEYSPNLELPVITFRCLDPDIANLSYRTVILNENYGSRWFNNYAVIPFGRMDQQYHWDALTNNLFDKLSLNIHLQYYLSDDFDITREEERYKAALKDYYNRTYNRDSSMSACMSIPYRLFQGIGISVKPSDTSKAFTQNIKKYRLLPVLPPEPINILESDTFYSEESIEHYLEIWNKHTEWRKTCKKPDHEKGEIYDEESLLYKLGKWEHERWNRWMISRKWKGINNREVVSSYYKEGNSKQQLYIGRIHPLIGSFMDVSFFGPYWKKLSGENKDFCNNDISAIQRTGDILKMKWTRATKEYYKN